jgi:hypothetical protein
MKIEIELDEKAIEAAVVAQVVARLRLEAFSTMEKMVKDVILTEVRSALRERASVLLKDLVLEDGRTLKQYVLDRINGRKLGSIHERLGVEGLIDGIIRNHSATWFRELVEPHMAKVKDRIREDFIDRLLRDTSSAKRDSL